jgi:hypothetical protein
VEDDDRGASVSCSVKEGKVGCPVAEKGVDPGETTTLFVSAFPKTKKK